MAKRVNSVAIPIVPDLAFVTKWEPKPDRTMQVDFEGISFRYAILDDKPAPLCQMVMPYGHNELRWVTRGGHMAHQYLTKDEPVLYRFAGDEDWNWLSLNTYKDCLRYNSEKLECQKE